MQASACSVGAQIPRSCSCPFMLVHISGPDGVCIIDFHCWCHLACWVFSGCCWGFFFLYFNPFFSCPTFLRYTMFIALAERQLDLSAGGIYREPRKPSSHSWAPVPWENTAAGTLRTNSKYSLSGRHRWIRQMQGHQLQPWLQGEYHVTILQGTKTEEQVQEWFTSRHCLKWLLFCLATRKDN